MSEFAYCIPFKLDLAALSAVCDITPEQADYYEQVDFTKIKNKKPVILYPALMWYYRMRKENPDYLRVMWRKREKTEARRQYRRERRRYYYSLYCNRYNEYRRTSSEYKERRKAYDKRYREKNREKYRAIARAKYANMTPEQRIEFNRRRREARKRRKEVQALCNEQQHINANNAGQSLQTS